MAIVNLDRQQEFAFISEMASTRHLLAYGIRVIRTAPFIETIRDPILTMLSIGVEKLYKLTLGLIDLERDRKWPTKAKMRAQGHKLVPMHQTIMGELRVRTANNSQYVRDLIAEIDADPVVVPVIDALDMYGQMGRFYYLDQLGEHPQAVSPDAAWHAVEQAALVDPNVTSHYQRALENPGDKQVWDQSIGALNNRIAVAIERIWITIAVCGRNHALGETGSTFGFEVHPDAVGRQ